MRRVFLIVYSYVSLLACSGSDGESTEATTAPGPSTTEGEATSGTEGSTSATTGPPPTYCGDYGGPCENDEGAENCVHSEGASYCGHRECFEYGPGGAPGRCNGTPHELQSICPWEKDTVPDVCIVTCNADSDCPEEGMVCVQCPAPFTDACQGLGVAGSNMCAWPYGTPLDSGARGSSARRRP